MFQIVASIFVLLLAFLVARWFWKRLTENKEVLVSEAQNVIDKKEELEVEGEKSDALTVEIDVTQKLVEKESEIQKKRKTLRNVEKGK